MNIKLSNRVYKNNYGKIYAYGGYEMIQINNNIVVKYNSNKLFKVANNSNNWQELKQMINREVNK